MEKAHVKKNMVSTVKWSDVENVAPVHKATTLYMWSKTSYHSLFHTYYFQNRTDSSFYPVLF